MRSIRLIMSKFLLGTVSQATAQTKCCCYTYQLMHWHEAAAPTSPHSEATTIPPAIHKQAHPKAATMICSDPRISEP
ncbi:hypothetical protein R3P38DRAFT_2871215 [Favolaschia claudopus]|uniref:Secreted protein n=1 Tax=Favolaschia claudopus TaxID=2862362 RepID=A0AAW0DB49_9AGAR